METALIFKAIAAVVGIATVAYTLHAIAVIEDLRQRLMDSERRRLSAEKRVLQLDAVLAEVIDEVEQLRGSEESLHQAITAAKERAEEW